MGNWLADIFRSLMFLIDQLVYGLIYYCYELLMYLANLDLFDMTKVYDGTADATNNIILNVASRVYVLLGIFMLFLLAFSILQYIVDPNQFSDNSKGFGKLVTRVMTSLILIVAVPFIFGIAFKAQSVILKNDVIGAIILGADTSSQVTSTSGDNNINTKMAQDLQYLIFGTFMHVSKDKAWAACDNGPVLGSVAMATSKSNKYQGEDGYPSDKADATGAVSCVDVLESEVMEPNDVKITDFFRLDDSDDAFKNRSFGNFGKILNARDGNGDYYFDYMFIISTIVGIIIVLMLLNACIDVAVRIVKLGFLEVIAPIPIIMYMNPKESASGSRLSKWASECFKTYAVLFIRLATIFFVFFLIDAIMNIIFIDPSNATYINEDKPTGIMSFFVQILVIIGLLMFANQVPKLLEDMLGLKGTGEFSLNPLKKINSSPLAAGVIGAGLGAAGGIAANTIAAAKNGNFHGIDNYRQMRAAGNGVAHSLFSSATKIGGGVGSSIGGGFSAGFRGGKGAYANKDMLKGARQGIVESNKERNERGYRRKLNADSNPELHYNWRDRLADKRDRFAGVENKTGGIGKLDADRQQIKKQMDNIKEQETAARQEMARLKQRASRPAHAAALNNANEEYAKMTSYLKTSKKDVDRALKSSDYASYSSQLQLDINKANASGNAAEAKMLQEQALDQASFDKLMQVKNYRDEQQKAYDEELKNIEKETYSSEDAKAIKQLEKQINEYDNNIQDLETKLKKYDRIDDIKPGGGPGGPGGK